MNSTKRHREERTARRGNPVWIAWLALAMTASVMTLPALASDFESRSVTPEYSGPSARTDNGRMGGTEPMVTRRTPIGPSSPDTGFDRQIEDRGAKISGEMDRRRDEAIRIKEEQLLKTNE